MGRILARHEMNTLIPIGWLALLEKSIALPVFCRGFVFLFSSHTGARKLADQLLLLNVFLDLIM